MKNIFSVIYKKLNDCPFNLFLFYLTIISLCILNIFVWVKLCYFCSVSSDNLAFGLYYEGENCFHYLFSPNREHGGGYIVLFLTKFLSSGLSKICHIHYSDFIGQYLAIIKGAIFCCFILCCIKFGSLVNLSKKAFIALFIFLSLLSYHLIYSLTGEWIIYDNTAFFRYLFPLIFFFIYFAFLYKYTIYPKLWNKFQHPLLIFILLNILIGTNLETVAIQALTFYIMLFAYNFVINIFKVKKQYTFHFNKTIYISFLILAIFFAIYMLSPGTSSLLHDRVSLYILTVEDIKHWFEACFLSNLTITILLIVTFSISFVISNNRKENNKIIYFFLLYLSSLIAMFSVLFSQKEGWVYILNGRVLFNYQFMLIFILFSIISYIIKHSSVKKFCINLLVIFLSVITVFVSLSVKKNYPNYKYITDNYLLEKQKNYIQEKMYRFYNIKNIQPELDINNIPINAETCLLWMPYSENEVCVNTDSTNIQRYYTLVYDEKPSAVTCFTKDAIQKFYDNGGYFTKEELNFIRFNDLYNDDFVLYSKGTKLSVKDIISIMNKPIDKLNYENYQTR